MTEKIRITDIPPGQAPEWVRKQWVGLELPIDEDAPKPGEGRQFGIQFGRAENLMGYPVKTADAMTALENRSLDKDFPKAGGAVQWWENNLPLEFIPRLVFSRAVCEIVPEEKTE